MTESPKPRASSGLASPPRQPFECPLWTRLGTNVSLGRQKPPGRSQGIATR